MRVVIDPNVYISATLSPSGTPAQLMQRWRLRQFDMIVSAKLIDELDTALHRVRFRPYVPSMTSTTSSMNYAAAPSPPTIPITPPRSAATPTTTT